MSVIIAVHNLFLSAVMFIYKCLGSVYVLMSLCECLDQLCVCLSVSLRPVTQLTDTQIIRTEF